MSSNGWIDFPENSSSTRGKAQMSGGQSRRRKPGLDDRTIPKRALRWIGFSEDDVKNRRRRKYWRLSRSQFATRWEQRVPPQSQLV
jgi:hypothetical protein